MAGLPDQTLVHFYRALVGHMDVWRQRMDATTNWAAATSAGMITFAFGTAASPHFVLLLALAFQGVFLLMESRRYQAFDLWRRRFRTLNRHYVAPVLLGSEEIPDATREALAGVAADLGRTVPHLSLLEAAGYRIRRNYGYLFLVTLIAWLLHILTQPRQADSLAELVQRAHIGPIPGGLVLAIVAAAAVAGSVLALRAPSEQMLDWAPLPAPLVRWPRRGGGARAGNSEREGSDGRET
ncbi:MAG TPA: DUF2270 domain-containing protein [Longimicrobiales bacterium]|nr:DUF2270 domain-containing protein [Longimicrobiales bacterium]